MTERGRRAAIAAAVAVASLLLVVPAALGSFGLRPGAEGFDVRATEHDGSPARLAGSHPFALVTDVRFREEAGGPYSEGDVRDIRIDRPVGLIENNQAVETCSAVAFSTPRQSPFQPSASGESCPLRSQVGYVTLRGAFPGGERSFGLFNLVAPPGFASLIGANPFGVPLTFASRIEDTGGGFRMSLESRGVSQAIDLTGIAIVQWGDPWLNQHDTERGDCLNELDPAAGFGEEASLDPEPPPPTTTYHPGQCSTGNPTSFPPLAYLSLPTSCAASASVISVAPWQAEEPITATAAEPIEGCDPRHQATNATAKPTSGRAASPSGLSFRLDVNQEGLTKNSTEQGRLIPEALAPSQIKRARVTLPAGIGLNPSVAAGLGTCSEAQFLAEAVDSPPGAGCPNASRIGDVTVSSPILRDPLAGGLFVAEPYANRFRSLLALFLVARAPERDVIVKLAGKVDADPGSGQLVATFDDLPKLPYSRLAVGFRESQRAPLATPAACGALTTRTELTPWLDQSATLAQETSFALSQGIGGGPCPTHLAPFTPAAEAGSYNRNSGAFTPFYLHLWRGDADQEITSYSARFAPGLLGRIAGIPYCPEAAIAAAGRNAGFAETNAPSCPDASRIGSTITGYGLGGSLAYAPGNLYLAGPYNGSPLSVVAIDSGTVGPFDLGVIVVRSAVRVDPRTAQVYLDSAGSDPIPHILKGIPLHLRDIRVRIDRPGFMVNPTSCAPMAVTSTLTGSGGVFSDPADDSTTSVQTPYQVAFCSSRTFRPKIALRQKGGARHGDHPGLTVKVTAPPGQANFSRAFVQLPRSLIFDQAQFGTICGIERARAGRCPRRSIYGKARAVTPLMAEPLEGPVVLRASRGPLPELVAQLDGGGIRIEIAGRIFSKDGRLRAVFDDLPDAPVSTFTLTMRGGRKGLIANSTDVCRSAPALARFLGQNNSGVVLRPRLVNPRCKSTK